jgi:hypothetical protein
MPTWGLRSGVPVSCHCQVVPTAGRHHPLPPAAAGAVTGAEDDVIDDEDVVVGVTDDDDMDDDDDVDVVSAVPDEAVDVLVTWEDVVAAPAACRRFVRVCECADVRPEPADVAVAVALR